MVVLAASVVTKPGKVLLSRQFVDMSRIRIGALLAAFLKLVGTGKQHTYLETEDVRYVYHPIEQLYLLLVTNIQSNIVEDLETLRLLSRLVPEYSMSVEEEKERINKAFELIFAFDEVISLGHKDNVTAVQVKQYCQMESHEEKLWKMVMRDKINETKEVLLRKASEIDRCKIENNRGDQGGFNSMQSMGSGRIVDRLCDFSRANSGSEFGSGPGFGLNADVEFKFTKSKASAATPRKGIGMQLGTSEKTNQFLESLKAEGEEIVENVQPKSGGPRAPAQPATDPITLTAKEKLNVTVQRDGRLIKFEIQGTLKLRILNQEDSLIKIQIESGRNPNVQYKTNPNTNKELFASENILGFKDPNKPFPTGQTSDVCLLRWRMQSVKESAIPLTINCWPDVSGNETYVSLDYEASSMFDLMTVVISIPLPALKEAPQVRQIDGKWRYISSRSILVWSILFIDNSNRSGSMEFVVPKADTSAFFPISVQFTAATTYSGLKVASVLPLKGDLLPKYSQQTQLITENYQVV